MDIRELFKRQGEKRKLDSLGAPKDAEHSREQRCEPPIPGAPCDSFSPDQHHDEEDVGRATSDSSDAAEVGTLADTTIATECETFAACDIGRVLRNRAVCRDRAEYHKFLTTPWTPAEDYPFKNESNGKRQFRHSWLNDFKWLSYSKAAKGALCRYCVIFEPPVKRGSLQGAFITKPYTNYKNFTTDARSHANSEWHKHSLEKAHNFVRTYNDASDVVAQFASGNANLAKERLRVLSSITSVIVFAGTHDLPLRGKHSSDGNFAGLLDMRIESGDVELKQHMENGAKNAKYTSVQVQNELVEVAGELIRNEVVTRINSAKCFTILALRTSREWSSFPWGQGMFTGQTKLEILFYGRTF
jgi:hypothetical protein